MGGHSVLSNTLIYPSGEAVALVGGLETWFLDRVLYKSVQTFHQKQPQPLVVWFPRAGRVKCVVFQVHVVAVVVVL